MATEEGNSVGLPISDLQNIGDISDLKSNSFLPISGFNRLTGFIEVYPKTTTFENTSPYSPLSNNLIYSDGTGNQVGANGASEKPILVARYLNRVSIKNSFRSLTDTCDIVLPRINNWILSDFRNVNNYSLIDPSNFNTSLLFSEGNIVRVYIGYDFQDKMMFHGYISNQSELSKC